MPEQTPFSVELLAGQDRKNFDCGTAALNTYLIAQASQDMKRNVAACFVAIDNRNGNVAGFYTLAACHVDLRILDDSWRRKLPRYPTAPAARLGRLAIDLKFQGRKLGAALLANAVGRVLKSDVAAHLIVVDAKDSKAAAFCLHHGFRQDPAVVLRLYAPVSSLKVLVD